jgi:hypothetical protein
VAEVSLGFKDIPIVCVNVKGYYDCFQKMLERSFADKLIYKPPNELLGMEPTARRVLLAIFRRLPFPVANVRLLASASQSDARARHQSEEDTLTRSL